MAGPSPGRARRGSGARKAASSPGATTTIPRGLRTSEATLATVFEVATPKEAWRPHSARIRSRISTAIAGGDPKRRCEAVTSR